MFLTQIQNTTADRQSYAKGAQNLLDQIKAQNMELIDALLEYANSIFQSFEQPLRKLLVLTLIKDAIVIKSGKLINKYISNRPLMTQIINFCTHKLGDSNPDRGIDLFDGEDPQNSALFLRLCLELVHYLATTFPLDSKKSPTKFKIQFDELVQMGVKFPPQSNLMNPLESQGSQQQPIKVSQPVKSVPQFQSNGERDQTMLQLNEMKKVLYSDIEMIHETIQENQGDMEYINDVLETYCDSMVQQEKKFGAQIKKAQSYEGVLNDDELSELLTLQDFTKNYPKFYKAYLAEGCTLEAYQVIRKQALNLINKIQSKDFGVTPQPNQSHFQPEKKQQNFNNHYNYDEEEDDMIKQIKQQSLIQEQQRQEKQNQEEQRRQQSIIDQQSKIQQQQLLEQQRKQEYDRKAEYERQERQRIIDEQNYQQQLQGEILERERQEKLLKQQKQQQQYKQQNQQSTQSAYQNQFNQSNQEYCITPQQFQQSSNIQQNDYQTQLMENDFQEVFDGLSQSSGTQSRYPMRMNQELIIKNYVGQPIKYDGTQFDILDNYGLTESQKKRFKMASITHKAALINSPQIQIGVKTNLQYVSLKEKNYLKLQIYMGNKTLYPIRNCRVTYEGDNQNFSMWIQPSQISEQIESGKQVKQEIICIFKRPEFRIANLIFSGMWQNKQLSANCFIPCTIVQFMDFKDVSAQIFRLKWRAKKQDCIKSETFLLNPKIIKTAFHIKKYFPKVCEFSEFSHFQEQQLDYISNQQQQKYISYKLGIQSFIEIGGIFELTHVNQNYMIKFIILPNLQCTIQLITQNKQIGCQLLNTLTWLIGMP